MLFRSSGASIAVNLTYADAGSKQTASVAGGLVKADSVTVTSNFNNNMTSAGATSVVGATVGESAELVLLSVKANASIAAITADVKASFEAASAAIANAINVTTNGTSFADADVEAPTFSLTGVNVALNVMVAKANGSFTAIMAGGENTITAGSANVNADVTVKAEAVGEAPVFDVSYASLKTNVATAITGANVNALVGGGNGVTAGNKIGRAHV